jgi:hypothetical protein
MPSRSVLLVLTAVALLTGCSHDTARAPASTQVLSGPPASPGGAGGASAGEPGRAGGASVDGPSGAGVQSPGAYAVDNPPGAKTCALLSAAIKGATLMVPGVIGDVVVASATADAPVADAAQRLSAAYTTAVAAKGTGREPDAVAAVSAAAADMAGVCDDSGLSTVG